MTYNYTDISLLEYPGEVSLVFYTGSCTCRCPWCFNKELLNKKPLSFKQMKDAINEHIDFISAVVFNGGDPILNPFLIKIINYSKSKGLKIKINTNGLVYEKTRKNIFIPYVNYINVSLKGNDDDYKQVLKLSKVEPIILNCDTLEYSFVYSPTLYPMKKIVNFHTFLKGKISFDWRTMFSNRYSQPDIFTINQMQTGNCLNPQYNFCKTPTKKQCVEVAKIFSDIPKKKLIVETKEFGRETII